VSLKQDIINAFNNAHCIEEIQDIVFEVVDDVAPNPCKLLFNNQKGEFQIKNPNQKLLFFIKIDQCTFFAEDGKKCDFAAFTESEFIFVELKKSNAKGRSLLNDAIEQLKATVEKFKAKKISLEQRKTLCIINILSDLNNFQGIPKAKASKSIDKAKFEAHYKVQLYLDQDKHYYQFD
jgi:hypothetical protein